MTPAAPTLLRVRFSKVGKVRFTSHRDVARIWERTLRRAGVPVRYSEGFSPRPRVAFGLALPTGYESYAEYLDIDLADDGVVHDFTERVRCALPTGVEVSDVGLIDRTVDSLQQAVIACTWSVEVDGVDASAMAAVIDRSLAAETIEVTRQRKGKTVVDDVRPGVLSIDRPEDTSTGARFVADLGTKPRGLRPTELLEAVEPTLRVTRVVRLHQWIQLGADRQEPLRPASAPAAAHASERVA